jgi:flagellar motor switch protein FliM
MPVLILQRDGTPGVTAGEFNDANQQHLTNTTAVVRLLIDKGLMTPEEFSRAHMQATAEIDQTFAEFRDSVIRQMLGQIPQDEEGRDG